MYDMRYKAFKGITDGASTRAGLFALLTAKGADFSGFDFWSDLTAAFLDAYLNRSLREALLMDDIRHGITYDHETKKYSINENFDATELIGYLMGKFTETEATYQVMAQQNLNIVSFNDVDSNVYGKKTINRDYDTVTIDITNGQKVIVDAFGQDKVSTKFGEDVTTMDYDERVTDVEIADRTNYDNYGGATDTATKAVKGFNSSDWSDAEKNTNSIGQRTNKIGGGKDTTTAYEFSDKNTRDEHTDVETRDARTDRQTHQESHDQQETSARQDKEEIQTYTDTLTHTRHIVLSPDKFFAIQKEMADYNLYKSVLDAVRESVTKGVF